MRTSGSIGWLSRALANLALAHALLACSLIVDGELSGKDFGSKEDGGSGQDDAGADASAPDAGGDAGGGAGGGGTGATDDAGSDGGADAGEDGGGTTDGGTDSGTHTPLSVESTAPDDGEDTTYGYQEVRVVFTVQVDALDDDQLEVTHRESGDRVAGSVATDGDTATFIPASPILRTGHYDVVVDRDVESTEGVPLGEDYAFAFEIAPGFPDDGEYIDRTDTPGSYEPDVAVDDEGNAIVVWLQRGAGGSGVYSNPWVSHYTYGFGWTTSEPLDTVDGAAHGVKIAVAPDGSAIAAWCHDPNSGTMPTEVMAAHYTRAGGWSTPELLGTDPDHDLEAQEVAVALNAAGDGVVAWARGDDAMADGAGDFFVSPYSGGSFGAAVAALDSGNPLSGSGRIEVALDEDGLALISGNLGGWHSIWRQQSSTTDWQRLAYVYDSDQAPREGAAMALDLDGLPHMCADYDWGSIEVVRASLTPKTRNAARYTEAFDPQCAMAGGRDVTAAWIMRGASATTRSIWAITYDHVADDWALAATDLFPDRTSSDVPSAPDVAAYQGTGALIAWTSNGELYTVERDDGSFGDATPRGRVDNPAEAWVRTAASELGTGVIVWQESDSSNPSRIAAQSFRGRP